jgi:hypothetical protein
VADEKIRVDIESVYDDKDAQQALEDAETIDKADPTLEVGADTSAAQSELAGVRDDAEKLTGHEWVTKILAETQSAKEDLEALQKEAQHTGDELEQAGNRGSGSFKGNGQAIADLTGPLGDASGAASDFAGVVEGLGATTQGVFASMGVSAETFEAALGPISLAIAAGAAAWTIFKQRSEDARKKAEEVRKQIEGINEAFRKGDVEGTAGGIADSFEKIATQAAAAGFNIDDYTQFLLEGTGPMADFVAGQHDLEQAAKDEVDALGGRAYQLGINNQKLAEVTATTGDLTSKLDANKASWDGANGSAEAHGRTVDHLANDVLPSYGLAAKDAKTDTDTLGKGMRETRQKAIDLNDEIDRLKGNLDVEEEALNFSEQITTAMETAKTKTGLSRQEVIDLEKSVIQAGETTGKTPLQIKAEVQKVEDGDLTAVAWDVEAWYQQNPVKIASQLDRPKLTSGSSGQGTAKPQMVEPAGTVNVLLPRGYRGDVVAEVTGAARRNGRRYGARGVRYANR